MSETEKNQFISTLKLIETIGEASTAAHGYGLILFTYEEAKDAPSGPELITIANGICDIADKLDELGKALEEVHEMRGEFSAADGVTLSDDPMPCGSE